MIEEGEQQLKRWVEALSRLRCGGKVLERDG